MKKLLHLTREETSAMGRARVSLVLSTVVVGLLTLGVTSAQATFVINDTEGDKVSLNNMKGVNSIPATVDGSDVTITTIGKVDSASGNATITPVKDGSLTELTFTPADAGMFNSFTFRGQFLATGTVDLTVQDNQGDLPQLFKFDVTKADADVGPFGIAAMPGSDETIKSIVLMDDSGFKEAKQFTFDLASAVPETSTWAMMLFGFAGLGFAGYRKTRKAVSFAA
jgi:hypothetical protein